LILLGTLSIVFSAMTYHFLKVLTSHSEAHENAGRLRDGTGPEFVAMGICAAVLIIFGITIPSPFSNLLRAAMGVLQ